MNSLVLIGIVAVPAADLLVLPVLCSNSILPLSLPCHFRFLTLLPPRRCELFILSYIPNEHCAGPSSTLRSGYH